jgi:hypothetical protein
MMGAGLRIGPNAHVPTQTDTGIGDCDLAIHSLRLRSVGIERKARNDANAVALPFRDRVMVGAV